MANEKTKSVGLKSGPVPADKLQHVKFYEKGFIKLLAVGILGIAVVFLGINQYRLQQMVSGDRQRTALEEQQRESGKSIEVRKLDLEVEKLQMEVERLRDGDVWLTKVLPIVPAMLGVAVFGFGVFQYLGQQQDNREQRMLEIWKPFLQKKTEIYFEALQAAATIAVKTNKDQDRLEAETKFKTLYFGPMVIVEDREVEKAMVEFRKTFEKEVENSNLEDKSLNLARKMRKSISDSFTIGLEDLPKEENLTTENNVSIK